MYLFSPWHPIVLFGIVSVLWFYALFAGIGTRVRDWIWAGAALAGAAMVAPGLLTQEPTLAAAAAFLGVFIASHWIFWSAAHGIEFRMAVRVRRGPAQARLPVGIAALRVARHGERVRVGLALSGGGYRAALFHAGVISMLEELAIPIDVVGSISGGSIVSSAYVTGTDPRAFANIVASGQLSLRRELATLQAVAKLVASVRIPRLDRPLLPGCNWSRTRVQADLLDRTFFQGMKLRELKSRRGPKLLIGATDLAHLSLVGATAQGVISVLVSPVVERLLQPTQIFGMLYRNHGPYFCPDRGNGVPTTMRVADMVAASGAFPGALNATAATDIWIDGTGHETEVEYLLADGGVIDNYGNVLMLAANELARSSEKNSSPDAELLADWKIDVLIISDGSAYPVTRERLSIRDQFAATMDAISDAGAGETLLSDLRQRPPTTVVLSPRGLLDSPFSASQLTLPLSIIEDLALESKELGGTSFALAGEDRDRFLQEMDSDLGKIVAVRQAGVQPQPIAELAESRRTHLERHGAWVPATARYTHLSEYLKLMDVGALMKLQILRRVCDFARSSTLDDRIKPERAMSLYQLGRQVTLIGHKHLSTAIDRLAESGTAPTLPQVRL